MSENISVRIDENGKVIPESPGIKSDHIPDDGKMVETPRTDDALWVRMYHPVGCGGVV